ncbi:MAG: hypothetical protein JWQ48_4037 [Conexibacter sp.]|nr:hypothetical protein [Conexibacter sp.]
MGHTTASVGERGSTWWIACAVAATLVVAAPNAAADVSQPFVPRFSADDTGGIAIAGNTLMSCPATDVNCAAGQQSTATGALLNNNGYAMGFVDVDGDPATFDSSRATVSLPAGATVLFAGLYFGGRTSAGTGGAAAPSAAARGTVAFRAPGAAGYAALPATVYDSSSVASAYVGFADVTSQVQAAGAGAYTVANVQTGSGLDRYGGWALVVAYHDAGAPPRNLTVFDGLATVQQGDPPLSLSIGGFATPPTGTVHTTVGVVAYEGDRGSAGDRLALNGQPLSDAANPVNNVFNSSIATSGADAGGRGPNYVNQLGFDADTIGADGVLPNGATSATLQESTTLDQYLTQVVTVATDLLAPRLTAGKRVENLTHPAGPNEPGDVLRYTVEAGNVGQDVAAGVSVADAVPAGTTYVPGSLVAAGAGQTDASGDDMGSVAAGGVAFGLGSLAPGATATVSFDVRIAAGLAAGTTIENVATATAHGTAAPIPLSAQTPAVQTIVTAPLVPVVPPAPPPVAPLAPGPVAPAPQRAFSVTASLAPGHARAGEPAVETVVLRSETAATVRDARVTIALPDADVLSISPSQGTCARNDAHAVRCALGTVAAGGRVVLRARVRGMRAGAGGLATRVTVSGKGIPTQRTVALRRVRVGPGRAGLAVGIRASVARARPGQVIGYRLVVRSTGAVTARAARVCGSLPGGLVLLSAPDARISAGRACWTIGSLGAGRSRAFTMTARVHRASAGMLVSPATARADNAPALRSARSAVSVVPLRPGACGSALARAAC